MHNKRVLVAMSGGVDSSVTAYLLKSQGYECVGATMRLTCPAPDPATGMSKVDRDIADAKAVAERLGIPPCARPAAGLRPQRYRALRDRLSGGADAQPMHHLQPPH
ncbi:MAG: hypothetical protein ACLTYW_09610 [Collinsella sp.]